MKVILDPGQTNWPVSPTQINQGSEGEGIMRQRAKHKANGKGWQEVENLVH